MRNSVGKIGVKDKERFRLRGEIKKRDAESIKSNERKEKRKQTNK